ncbi:DUF1365 domain-containing protein [Primorskyibacter sp. S87]|uniref:DUF1365 domain-containing protein n=1 Tax=Primorskyibacter sp. S87 TaxID=3415126 RepID=UPI003C7D290F
MIDHIQAHTTHARRGRLGNAFRYGVDLVLTDMTATPPWPISRNRFNLWSLWDREHGGPRRNGRGVEWFRDELRKRGFPVQRAKLLLLTQPTFLWFHFNPVSFWIATIDDAPCAFVAEVNNTFGHRHCYFCAHDDFRPIAAADTLTATKLMHVSPFQQVDGIYKFRFSLTALAVKIRINYQNGREGVVATLSGPRTPATSRSLLWAALRRPAGAVRVLALIHWQAAILFLKRAPFMKTPAPPELAVSESPTFREKAL